MPESVRPPVWPDLARARAAPAKPVAADPRAAFFRQALDRAGAEQPTRAGEGAAVSSAPAQAIAPARQPASVQAADPARPLRPGSLLNIRV